MAATIPGAGITTPLTLTEDGNLDTLTLTSTDADATSGPILKLNRNSASPADSDDIGKILFTGENDASESIDYATIRGDLLDVTDGTEDGVIKFETIVAGTNREIARFGNGVGAVFNEDSQDLDFRVETNSNAYGLFVDAGNDAVMIGGVGSSSGTTDHRLVLFDFGQINVFRQGANSLRSAVIFYNADSGSNIGSITMQSSATAFNTSSDYRLKENVDYDWDATTTLKQLKPAKFNWIADDTNTLLEGFIAHEVSSVVPQAIVGEKDKVATAEDVAAGFGGAVGDPIYQGIDQSKLVPLMVKTIQELEARIKTLEDA